MKKTILTLAALAAFASVAVAQEDVKLPERPKSSQKYVDYSQKEKGFWISAGLTAMGGFYGQQSSFQAGADLVLGYRFNDFIRIGAGISPICNAVKGENFPGAGTRPLVEVPVYLDVRGNFFPQKPRMFAPYWSADIGWTINSGLYLSPTVGLKFGDVRNDFLLGFSYIMQQFNYSADSKGIIHYACLRLAYEF